jgi:hypothetical protein
MVALRLLPTSPRRRRRLAWTAASLGVVVVIVAAIALMPRGESEPETAVRTEPEQAAEPQSTFRFTPARRREADALVRRFALQAAARRNPAAVWDDASTAMQASVGRKEWNAGDLPGVVPFDSDALRSLSWRVIFREPDRVGIDVLLVARPGSKQRSTVYAADLVLERGRLVVDSWAPRASFATPGPAPGKTKTTTTTSAAPAKPQSAHGQLDARWLLVPAGVLALVVLVPLGLVVRNAIRTRRAYRRHARR